MKKNSIPLFIGVIVSFIAIWFVNDLLLVDPCLDNNGNFNYSKGECLLKNGDVKVSVLGNYLIAIYFFMGMLISLSVSFFIRKVFKIEQ
ncbi:MAG: hypothetical protein ACI9YH_002778 [Colwellia sp.]|jgi:hypothetical protein